MNKYCVVTTYIDHLQPVNSVRWSPDGTCVASCSNDKKIKIFDIRSGRIIQHYDAHSAPVTCLSYHPSGKYLVSSSLDSTVKIWDTFNSQILYTVHGHHGPVNSVAFSRDGDFICSGGADTTLMIWKNNLSGIGYPSKSKNPEEEGLSKPVTIPKKRAKSKTGFKCCNKKKKLNNSSSMNKYKKEEIKSNSKLKNSKSTMNSKNSNQNVKTNINIYGSNMYNNSTIKSNGMVLNNTNQSNNNKFVTLPPELKTTFEKFISQLDLVGKTMKIMDQRIQNLEGQVSTLFNRVKKGFVQKQPPQMGDYQYLLENSNNFFPNNSMNNNEISQKLNNHNFNDDTMNLKDENKKYLYKTEIETNQNINNCQEKPNDEDNIYKGQIQEEFGYTGEEKEGEEQINDNIDQYQENKYNNEQEYEEGQGEEYEEVQGEEYEHGQGEEYEQGQGEEYEQGQGEEEYINEEEYEQGEEYEQDQENGEEQADYDYKNEESPNK